VRLANAYSATLGASDAQYHDVLSGPGITFPDGASVVAALRVVRRRPDAHRVRGADFMRRVFELSAANGPRHFLVGGTPDLVAALSRKLRALNPSVHIVGCYAPPFEPLSPSFVAGIARATSAAKADVVWLGLGTPKQDHVAAELHKALGVSAVGVGAAFDFIAGNRPEAPRWLQAVGLEWAHRLALEPARLWRRYLLGNVLFVALLLSEVVRRSGQR
jgi:N-acetylglucosaminyldiphosphoundecaprenol N-acetyl-beta-D-mannosaminyltransferase